jgi:enoyl-[acyl-carrier protein] reductase III
LGVGGTSGPWRSAEISPVVEHNPLRSFCGEAGCEKIPPVNSTAGHSRLRGKKALITGGARGIGAAICRRLARAGCGVAINYFSSSDEAEALRGELEELGVPAFTFQANVTDVQAVKEMVEAISESFGAIDILVSNAASGVLRPALEMSTKHWRWCMETNALALNHLVREARPLMRPGSRVLALSSLGAHRAIPNYAFIGASKAALEALVRSLSMELAPDGISVNTISAGVVDTDAIKHFPNREQLLEESRARSQLGRELTAEDVADVAYLLCLPEAEAIRGQTIVVDAGFSVCG